MINVRGNYGDFYQAGRSRGETKQYAGLPSVLELGQDVRGGQEVAVAINEEGVAVEDVVIAASAGGVVKLIDNGADGIGDIVIFRCC
jgi:hypothetical protein